MLKKLIIFTCIAGISLLFAGDLMAKVIHVKAKVTPTTFTGKCPKRFQFAAKITVNRPGPVKYKWIRSDGAIAPVKTIIFRRPGSKVVTTYWQLSAEGTRWQAVRILAPNKMVSNKAKFTLKCRADEARPCGISFKSMSKKSGSPGTTFKMYGVWGASQGSKLPCINKGGQNKLIVQSWSNSVLKVKIPKGLAPGKYRVGVYCRNPRLGKTYGTTWKDFTVLARLIVAPVKPIRPIQIAPRACPDPAAYSISFRVVRRDPTSRFKGLVRITGVVKNVGKKAFISGPNQAAAYLYQIPMGGTPREVAKKEITNLKPGESFNLVFQRNWYSASPAEGEFPPSYRLLISYDPDIYMDANKNNDDCNQKNNKKEKSGAGINSLLR